MSSLQKLWATGVMAAVIIPNIVVIFTGRESFPYTNAPMFSHYIGPETYFYDFKFIAVKGKQKYEVFPRDKGAIKTARLRIMRFMFTGIYGSAEPDPPFGYFRNDTPIKLEKRLTNFFRAYFDHVPADSAAPQFIRLEVSQYTRQLQYTSTHEVGRYNLFTQKFSHTWNAAP